MLLIDKVPIRTRARLYVKHCTDEQIEPMLDQWKKSGRRHELRVLQKELLKKGRSLGNSDKFK